MVRDKLDDELPKENYTFILQDPHSNKQMMVNSPIARARFKEQSSRQKEKIKSLFKEKGTDLLELNSSEDFALSLSSFMKKRAMELRV